MYLLKAHGTTSGKKCLINLVVVGHVDSGKSTLMGHLLFILGCVSSRVMHKYEQVKFQSKFENMIMNDI